MDGWMDDAASLPSICPEIAKRFSPNCKCTSLHANASVRLSQPPFPAPIRFSIKIQTKIEDLKRSVLQWDGPCFCSRRPGGGRYLSGRDPREPSPYLGYYTHLGQGPASHLWCVLNPLSIRVGVLDEERLWNERCVCVHIECRWSLSDSKGVF